MSRARAASREYTRRVYYSNDKPKIRLAFVSIFARSTPLNSARDAMGFSFSMPRPPSRLDEPVVSTQPLLQTLIEPGHHRLERLLVAPVEPMT